MHNFWQDPSGYLSQPEQRDTPQRCDLWSAAPWYPH